MLFFIAQLYFKQTNKQTNKQKVFYPVFFHWLGNLFHLFYNLSLTRLHIISVDGGTCGYRSVHSRFRIVGGNNSQRGMWPWQVGLYRRIGKDGKITVYRIKLKLVTCLKLRIFSKSHMLTGRK